MNPFEKCNICENRGFLMEKRTIEKFEYKFPLHCECAKGKQMANLMPSLKSKYNTNDIIARNKRKAIPSEATISKIKKMISLNFNREGRSQFIKYEVEQEELMA